ncbi:hypothetical protein GX586_14235 [bacterium]|nr:hypothetical protein [bacterium]
MTGTLAAVAAAGALAACAATNAPAYPPPAPPMAPPHPGRYIQRTMSLLAASTPAHRNTVRILFYGQSITRQEWWLDVVAGLRQRFPHADIVAENLAIGGFASQKLVKTTPRDIRVFYPDLVVFHVYGAHDKYEEIIAFIRRNTTAEIAMQTDHFGAKADPSRPDEGWDAFMNGEVLPRVARTYGCELIDVRAGWRRHLLDNKLEPQALLSDGVHLNERGCELMARLVSSGLVCRAAAPGGEAEGPVRTFSGDSLSFTNGVMKLAFAGNRVTAIAAPHAGKAGSARVLIDGNPPSAFPALYAFTRANAGPGVDWPWSVSAPVVISSRTKPVEEDWVITVVTGDAACFTFDVRGSKTGPDGAGVSTQDFVSTSGRIAIAAEDWWLETGKGRPSPIAPGYELRFASILLGTDVYVPPAVTDTAHEIETVLASGLDNGPHTLELVAESGGSVPLKAIRVYSPPK